LAQGERHKLPTAVPMPLFSGHRVAQDGQASGAANQGSPVAATSRGSGRRSSKDMHSSPSAAARGPASKESRASSHSAVGCSSPGSGGGGGGGRGLLSVSALGAGAGRGPSSKETTLSGLMSTFSRSKSPRGSPPDSRYSTKEARLGSSKSPQGSPSPSRDSTKELRAGSKERHQFGGSRASQNKRSRKGSRQGRSSTGTPASLSRVTSRSVTKSSDSDSSDEFDPDFLASIDPSTLPLHMREGAIAKPGEDVRKRPLHHSSDDDDDTWGTHSEPLGQDPGPRWEKPAPRASLLSKMGTSLLGALKEEERFMDVMIRTRTLVLMSCPCLIWTAASITMLGIFVWCFYQRIRKDFQQVIADAALLRTEANFAAVLDPAIGVVRALALGARSGVLGDSSPYAAIAEIVAPEMLVAPALRLVQVFGAADRMVLMRPGSLHEVGLPAVERQPLVHALAASCQFIDLLSCLAPNGTAAPTLTPVPAENASIAWQAPEFFQYGAQGEPLEPPSWVFSMRLAAHVNATEMLALDVVVNLAHAFHATQDTAPSGDGAVYVTYADGTLLTGSDWEPSAASDGAGGVFYPTLWDLDLPWSDEVKLAMVAGDRRSEVWVGPDLAVVRPLAAGELGGLGAGAAQAALRAVVFVTRAGSVNKLLEQFVLAAIVVGAMPFVAGVLLSLTLVPYCLVLRCARRRGRQKHERWREMTAASKEKVVFQSGEQPGPEGTALAESVSTEMVVARKGMVGSQPRGLAVFDIAALSSGAVAKKEGVALQSSAFPVSEITVLSEGADTEMAASRRGKVAAWPGELAVSQSTAPSESADAEMVGATKSEHALQPAVLPVPEITVLSEGAATEMVGSRRGKVAARPGELAVSQSTALSESAATEMVAATKGKRAFHITLKKTEFQRALGIAYNDVTMVIASIGDGLVMQWNNANPDHSVRVGDSISEVNEVKGDAGALDKEICTKDLLRLKILRGAVA